MHEYCETYDKWRKMIARTNLYFVFFVFTLEFIMYFILKSCNLINQPIPIYLLAFLIMPTIINFFIIAMGEIISRHISPDSQLSNYLPVVQMTILCLVVTSTHFIYSITFATFCFPIIATVIFGDRKMTQNISLLCGAFLTIALIVRKYSPFKLGVDNGYLVEAIVAFSTIIACRIICEVLIMYMEEKSDIIRCGYLQQVDLKEQLAKDQKTGLHGHAALMNTLHRMINQSEKENQDIALAIIDIDNFKSVNDTYGHLKGDQVIGILSELMKEQNNSNRFMARFGGEEFAIIFTKNEKEKAYGFIEKLRLEFQRQSSHFCEEAITISAGVAIWQPEWAMEELFEKADAAMYEAKIKGKNRTILYD